MQFVLMEPWCLREGIVSAMFARKWCCSAGENRWFAVGDQCISPVVVVGIGVTDSRRSCDPPLDDDLVDLVSPLPRLLCRERVLKMYVCMYVSMYLYVSMYVCVYIYICICVCIYIYNISISMWGCMPGPVGVTDSLKDHLDLTPSNTV